MTVDFNPEQVVRLCLCSTAKNNQCWCNADENRIEQCFAAHSCSQLSTIFNNIVTPDSCSTILFNIVDMCEQRGQQNIVQYINPSKQPALRFYACKAGCNAAHCVIRTSCNTNNRGFTVD
jgi:hypothetical protein